MNAATKLLYPRLGEHGRRGSRKIARTRAPDICRASLSPRNDRAALPRIPQQHGCLNEDSTDRHAEVEGEISRELCLDKELQAAKECWPQGGCEF